MTSPTSNPLPPEVTAALQRGNFVEAIKLLRKSASTMSLRDAKDAITRHQQPAATPSMSRTGPVDLPIEAQQAIRRGNKIEAIAIVREKRRIGLMEAKEAVDAYQRANVDSRLGLSPGEVPPTSNAIWLAALLVIAVFGAWLFLL